MTALAEYTVLPPGVDQGEETPVVELLAEDVELSLTTGDGRSVPLTAELRAVLSHAAEALGHGQAVTVEPRRVVLSTQEAADILGVSRPTLVKLLETGEIAYTQPSRHRRVMLADVLDYQQRSRTRRRAVLTEMSADAAEDDAYGRLSEFTETR